MTRLYFQIGQPEASGLYRTRLDLPLPITMEAQGDGIFITSGKGLEPVMIFTHETHFRSERTLHERDETPAAPPALMSQGACFPTEDIRARPACHAGLEEDN